MSLAIESLAKSYANTRSTLARTDCLQNEQFILAPDNSGIIDSVVRPKESKFLAMDRHTSTLMTNHARMGVTKVSRNCGKK